MKTGRAVHLHRDLRLLKSCCVLFGYKVQGGWLVVAKGRVITSLLKGDSDCSWAQQPPLGEHSTSRSLRGMDGWVNEGGPRVKGKQSPYTLSEALLRPRVVWTVKVPVCMRVCDLSVISISLTSWFLLLTDTFERDHHFQGEPVTTKYTGRPALPLRSTLITFFF